MFRYGYRKRMCCSRSTLPLKQLRIIGHHRTVVMVVTAVLVHIVGQAGVEDGVYSLIDKLLHVSVHDLRRVTGRIRRNGELAQFVGMAGGKPGNLHLEAQRGEYGVPHGQKLVHTQGQRQADGSPAGGGRLSGR